MVVREATLQVLMIATLLVRLAKTEDTIDLDRYQSN
jgi:hypothetical protein